MKVHPNDPSRETAILLVHAIDPRKKSQKVVHKTKCVSSFNVKDLVNTVTTAGSLTLRKAQFRQQDLLGIVEEKDRQARMLPAKKREAAVVVVVAKYARESRVAGHHNHDPAVMGMDAHFYSIQTVEGVGCVSG